MSESHISWLFAFAASLAACAETDDAVGVDAAFSTSDAAVPLTVLEQLAASGTWSSYFRARDVGCTGCREVDLFEHVSDPTCDCVYLTVHRFHDVVPANNPFGYMAGDEYCTQVIRLEEVTVAGLDPSRRSVVTSTFISGDCGPPAGFTVSTLFDAQQVDAEGLPGLIASFQPSPFDPFGHSTGYPTDLADLLSSGSSVPLVRCAEADHAPGRAYCMPACDFPGADPGRTECGFPPYEDVAP